MKIFPNWHKTKLYRFKDIEFNNTIYQQVLIDVYKTLHKETSGCI